MTLLSLSEVVGQLLPQIPQVLDSVEDCGDLGVAEAERSEGVKGVVALVGVEWRHLGGRVGRVVVGELGMFDEGRRVILMSPDVVVEVGLQDLVDPLGLAVGLRMEGR